jgi:RimJ/RimL family protein N-acetyltransferase
MRRTKDKVVAPAAKSRKAAPAEKTRKAAALASRKAATPRNPVAKAKPRASAATAKSRIAPVAKPRIAPVAKPRIAAVAKPRVTAAAKPRTTAGAKSRASAQAPKPQKSKAANPLQAPVPAAPRKATKPRKPAVAVPPRQAEMTVTPRKPVVATPSAEALKLKAAMEKLSARRDRDRLPHRIATRRLVLRAPIRGDVPALVALADNKNIADRLSRLPSPYTRADGIAFVEIFAQRADERPYAITLDSAFVGVVGLTFHVGDPPELGYWLGEPHWGKGIMGEAVSGLLDAVAATGAFPAIVARALADNAGSLHVLEKAGFRRTGEKIDDCGNHKDRLIVTLRREMRG